ncbi:MAG: hypothetical protein IJL06_04790 [Kiritimatiellae bacterium]|nr:hypothetical protein [Kiritimatiellia bacterium]
MHDNEIKPATRRQLEKLAETRGVLVEDLVASILQDAVSVTSSASEVSVTGAKSPARPVAVAG